LSGHAVGSAGLSGFSWSIGPNPTNKGRRFPDPARVDSDDPFDWRAYRGFGVGWQGRSLELIGTATGCPNAIAPT